MMRGCFGVWLLLNLWFSLTLCIYSLGQKKYIRTLYILPLAGASHYILQIFGGDYGAKPSNALVVFICALCSFGIFFLIYKEYRYRQTHISEMSVKYAVDALPTGICCYDETGRVTLKNQIMESLHWKMTGKALLNGETLEKMIFSGSQKPFDFHFLETGENVVVILPTQKVYEFHKEILENPQPKARKEYVLTASEITEEYQKTQTLLEKQETVTKLNQRLHEYNKEILSVITAQEVLNAKVKIHDELGASLLRVKKYLADCQTKDVQDKTKQEEEKKKILESLRQNLTFLQRELTPSELDEYTLLLETARQLDVQIEIMGRLPEEERIRNICVTALHECLTNTLRHAKGDVLKVTFVEKGDNIQAVYTNNGIAPSGDIVEKGGLKHLRNLVEQEDGTMEIQAEEGFCLTITLRKRGNIYGI